MRFTPEFLDDTLRSVREGNKVVVRATSLDFSTVLREELRARGATPKELSHVNVYFPSMSSSGAVDRNGKG